MHRAQETKAKWLSQAVVIAAQSVTKQRVTRKPMRYVIVVIVGEVLAHRWSAGQCARQDAVTVTKGTLKVYASSEHGRRHFCPDCGTGLFYTNVKMLPEIIDIQSATYDDPEAVPARAHIQVAERIGWMEHAHELPAFERYPPRK